MLQVDGLPTYISDGIVLFGTPSSCSFGYQEPLPPLEFGEVVDCNYEEFIPS